jgi:rfaE bifunctional protein kinase chain/domain
MVNILHCFTSMQSVNIGVIGDFVVDKYILGTVGRISPEAPVPVVVAQEIRYIPGMAGNVALNLVSLGAQVFLFGRLGKDAGGAVFKEYLSRYGVDLQGVLEEENYPTTVKERVIAHSQQLLRIDYELIQEVEAAFEDKILSCLKKVISQLHILAISDYKKGLLTQSLTQKIIKLAQEYHVKVVVDPKGEDYTKYAGAFLIKPNLQEAYLAAKLTKTAELKDVAKKILETTKTDYLLITRSEEGMSLFSQSGLSQHFPVTARAVKDVTGAGDTVLAMMAYALANQVDMADSISLANIAASLVIQKMGCAQVNLSEVAQEVVSLAKVSKIFETEDLKALHQILAKQPYALLSLKGPQSSYELLDALKKITQQASSKVLVYLDSEDTNHKLISLLSSLEEVSYIVKSPSHMLELLKKFIPQKAFMIANDELKEVQNPLHLLEELLNETLT